MRRILLTLLFSAALSSAAAQRPRLKIEWGALAGIRIPHYSADVHVADISNRLGWQAGIFSAVNFGAFAIEPQIFYVREGFRIRPVGADAIRIKTHSIDVPVLASLRVLRPVRLYAGPVLTVLNDCKQKSSGDLLDFGRVRPTLSFTVGAGAVLLRHMLIDLRYNGQFRAKHDVVLPDGSQLDKLRSYNFALSVGYLC